MNRLSKTLEGLLARTAFNTTKSGQTHSLQDFLFLELLHEEGSLAYQLLASRLKDWELFQIRLRIEHELRVAPTDTTPQLPAYFFRTFAEELAAAYDSVRHLSTAHALIRIASDRTTAAARVLEMYHLTPELLAAELQRLTAPAGGERQHSMHLEQADSEVFPHSTPFRPSDTPDEPSTAVQDTTLRQLAPFGTELTRLAREGALDPVIGREAEIDRMVQILSRRRKNNPILVGEAGVGKSALVEGLAQRIVTGNVPRTLAGRRIFSLDLASLVAGTKFRGEFEERMQQLLEALRSSHDTILFIDEIHTIVGAGATQGSLDAANLLKPLLARGEVQTIGATTLDEYREQIERDPALERRFQRVLVEPTSPEATLHILKQLAPHYERHHGVHYTESALQACVTLADRYLTERHFPDKAIDLLDEAGARLHLSTAPVPQPAACNAAEHSDRTAEAPALLLPEIDERHIAEVLTSMTGIPTERLTSGERERLQGLQAHLQRHVIGQHEAVERISRTIRRARAGLKDERRPIGVFLFVGPTGVGKTLLAKEVSKWLFDERRGLIRIDMSEYSEKHNVSRLIGSPPGYVGYGEGGQLTEAVRRQPYAVVLFDEIEKAHPDLFNTLLQLLDEGHLTDGAGRRVDFRNTILIMTSNVGSRAAALRPAPVGYTAGLPDPAASDAATNDLYRRELERTFAPEFLNRVDDIVVFRTLEPHDVERIVDLELRDIVSRTERLGYRIRITDRAKQRLAELGYESRYGARALRRTLLDRVEEPLAALIVDGQLRSGDTVVVESDRLQGVRLRVA